MTRCLIHQQILSVVRLLNTGGCSLRKCSLVEDQASVGATTPTGPMHNGKVGRWSLQMDDPLVWDGPHDS